MNARADDSLFMGAVVPSVSIDNMVNQREAVRERIQQAFALLREGREIAEAANIGFPRFKIETNRYQITSFLDAERQAETDKDILRELDSGAWQHLLNESGLRTFMDKTAREQWNRAIEKGEFPAFTLDNIKATFSDLYGARGEMFERGVIACFKRLSWDYKTNQPFRFGKRLVLRFIRGKVIAGRNTTHTSLGYVNHNHTDELDDLSRVMHVLDGKPEPDHRTGWFSRLNHVNVTTDPDAEDDYFSVRSFRNGNGHLTFKRLELVEKMNKILAKHYPGALPHNPHVGE